MYTEYHNSCSSGSGRNPRPVSGKAIAALILGILSVLFSSVFFIGILLACIGIVCALSSRQIYISGDTLQKHRTPMDITAKIGFIFSVVGIVLGILVPLILGVFTYQAFNTSDFFQEEVPYIEEIPDVEEIPDSEPYQTLPYEEIPEEEPYDMPDNIPYDFPQESPYRYDAPYNFDFPYGHEEPAPREYEDSGLQQL